MYLYLQPLLNVFSASAHLPLPHEKSGRAVLITERNKTDSALSGYGLFVQVVGMWALGDSCAFKRASLGNDALCEDKQGKDRQANLGRSPFGINRLRGLDQIDHVDKAEAKQ